MEMVDPIEDFAQSTQRRQAWSLIWTGVVLVVLGGAGTALLCVPWSRRGIGESPRLEIVGPFLLLVGIPILLYGLALRFRKRRREDR
jgi:hypothetical protein